MSTNDLRDLKFAAGYDLAFVTISVLTWYWFIRPARQDMFRPNPKDKFAPTPAASRGSQSSLQRAGPDSALVVDTETERGVSTERRCHKVLTKSHWLVKLWKWDIKNYASTDVYHYLLFQRNCMIVFFTISLLTLSIGFPIIWTASSPLKYDQNGKLVAKTFFDRAVILNVPTSAYFRLWVLYGLVWAVFAVSVTGACFHYRAVGSDKFRTFSNRRKLARDRSRFLPNQYTVCVHGIDKNLRDSERVRNALLQFYDEDQICCVNLVMDYNEAFYAYKQYSKAVDAVQKLQRKIDHLLVEGHRRWRLRSRLMKCLYWKRLNEPNSPDSRRAARGLRRCKMVAPISSTLQDCAVPLIAPEPSPGGKRELSVLPERSGEDGGVSSPYDAPSADSYEECESIPASSNAQQQRRISLPTPEKFRVHVGQLPFTTLDSAVLSPRTAPRAGPVRSPRELNARERAYLRQLQEELGEKETAARNRLQELETLIVKRPTSNVGTAFVCLSSSQAARFALTNDFADPACPVFRAHHGSGESRQSLTRPPGSTTSLSSPAVAADSAAVEGRCATCNRQAGSRHCRCRRPKWDANWRVREAPPPEDIVWANMAVGRLHRAYLIFAVNLAIFLLLFTLTSSTVATALLFSVASNLEKVLEDQSFFKVSVSGWLMPLFLYLINALLLPFLVSWGADASKFWKRSSRDRTVLYANVNYMVINSLVFPVLGTTSFQTLALFITNTPWGQIPSILGRMAAGASGSFVLRYLINTICINTSMQLMQLPMFSQQRVLLKLGKRANRWDFDYGFWYAFHLAVFSVCIVFSVDFPLVPLGGAIFFACKFWVDKYNLTMKVWRTRSESAGAVASSAVSFIFFFISLYMFLMAGYFFAVALARGSPTSSTVPVIEVSSDVTEPSTPINVSQLPSSLENQTRGLTIGAVFLLLASISLSVTAAAEKAQRSLLVAHAKKVRQLLQKARVKIARRLENWGLISPQRGILECEVGDSLSRTKIAYLKQAYVHPFECGNRLNLVINPSPPSPGSAGEEFEP